MTDTTGWTGWAIVELMGHRRLSGQVSEQTIAGSRFVRLDIPSDPKVTQFYAPAAVYCITPTSEDIARAAALPSAPIQLGGRAPWDDEDDTIEVDVL